MKKILAMAAAAALTCGVSAYAANPFSDVSAGDWAYQAVTSLSEQGVVEGYPDGTFKGQQNITRYEMAQIIARMLAKEDQYNAEQRAVIDKLASEYADELNSLGVRVSNLEKKVGNVRFTGDARMQWQHVDKTKTESDSDSYNARFRLNASAQVSDKVTVEGRFVSDFDFVDEDTANTSMDRIHAVYAPSDNFSFDLGRTSLWLGQTGVLYDDTFDGVKMVYDTGKVGLEAGYGRMKEMYDVPSTMLGATTDEDGNTVPLNKNKESWYVQAKGNAGPVALNAFYLDFTRDLQNVTSGDKNAKLWGVGAAFNLGPVMVDGDYITNTMKNTVSGVSYDKPKLWTAGVTFGEFDQEKVGSFAIGARYVSADKGSYFGSSTLDLTNQLEDSWNNGAKFWVAKASVAVAKNVELDGYYNFNAKAKTAVNGSKDLEDSYGAELNYYF
jgi:hypothetical protein